MSKTQIELERDLMNVDEATESSPECMRPDESNPLLRCDTEEEQFETTQKIKMTDSGEKAGNTSDRDYLGQTIKQPLKEIALYTASTGKNQTASTGRPPKP